MRNRINVIVHEVLVGAYYIVVQVPIYGGFKSLSPHWMTFDANCNSVDKVVQNFSNGLHLHVASFKRRPVSCFYSNYSKQCASMGMNDRSLYQNGLENIRHFTQSSYQVGLIDETHHLGPNGMIFVDSSSNSAADDQLMDFISKAIDNTEALPNYADVESVTSFDSVPTVPPPVSDSLNIDVNSLPGQETNFADIVSEMNKSTADIINGGENVLNNVFDSVTSSLTTSLTNANEAVDDAITEIISFVNKSGESAGNKLTGLSSELKEASGRAGLFALDVLRGTIIVVEDSLIQGGKTVGYAYSFVREFLPPEFQEALSLYEDIVEKVLNPAGTTFQQVHFTFLAF